MHCKTVKPDAPSTGEWVEGSDDGISWTARSNVVRRWMWHLIPRPKLNTRRLARRRQTIGWRRPSKHAVTGQRQDSLTKHINNVQTTSARHQLTLQGLQTSHH